MVLPSYIEQAVPNTVPDEYKMINVSPGAYRVATTGEVKIVNSGGWDNDQTQTCIDAFSSDYPKFGCEGFTCDHCVIAQNLYDSQKRSAKFFQRKRAEQTITQ